MKQLDFTIRQYQETSPARSEFDKDSNSRLTVWYDQDVAPVLEEYSRRPRFRQHATWPITELRAGAKTELRGLIEQLDSSLVECARGILETMESDGILNALKSEFPSSEKVTSSSCAIDGHVNIEEVLETSEWSPIDDLLRQLEYFAKRPWEDLVNVQDYFGTQPRVSSGENGIAICWGDSILSVNPRLTPIGNFIERSMLERIRPSRKLFLESRKYLAEIEKKQGKKLWKQVENIHCQYETDHYAILNALDDVEDKHLTDACVALTQIYVATNENADVGWLGLEPETVEHGIRDITARMNSLRGPEIHDRIATHLTRLHKLYEPGESTEAELENLIASRNLVVNLKERIVYWKASPFGVSKKQFKFLCLLAERVKTKRRVIGNDLDAAESTSDSALSSLVDRLRKRIPPELAAVIKNDGDGYYLNLPTNKVAVGSQKE